MLDARLRRDGIQPRHIDGSAELEANLSYGQLEADMRHLFNEDIGFGRKDLPVVTAGLEEARDVDWTPAQSIEDYRDRHHR